MTIGTFFTDIAERHAETTLNDGYIEAGPPSLSQPVVMSVCKDDEARQGQRDGPLALPSSDLGPWLVERSSPYRVADDPSEGR
jgi:hypothetical protein